jgi:hypothetical protein
MLNRLSANFSSLIQESVDWLPPPSDVGWGILAEKIDESVRFSSTTTLAIPLTAISIDPLIQFELALVREHPFVAMPVVDEIDDRQEPDSLQTLGGMWLALATSFDRLFLALGNPLSPTSSIHLIDSQSAGTNIDRSQPVIFLDRTAEISLPIASFSDLQTNSIQTNTDRQFTEIPIWNHSISSQVISIFSERLSHQTMPVLESAFSAIGWQSPFPIVISSDREMLSQPTFETTIDGITVNPTSSPLSFIFPQIQPIVREFSLPTLSVSLLNEISAKPPIDLTPPPPKISAPHESTVATTTFNGGIHVTITAQTIDPSTADETARSIAGQVLREINRLTEQDRFRRGLSPSPTQHF